MSSNRRGLQDLALNMRRALTVRYQNIGARGGVFPSSRLEWLALAAFVCLLVVAAGLRFYDLPEQSLRHDEAAAANISRGALPEVILGTRCCNSSPILYPLALWAAQKVESTPFSVRVLPAAASVLTVAVMLFLLPRLGVARWAAFLAALLATLSIAAIEHAQDAREYSIDALLAALMIAGLLWYLRDGRKALLCVALFLGPLLQYGLVLFGAAVMCAAMVLPSPRTLAAPECNSYLGRVRNWLRQRIVLLWPAACFLAGCGISYAVTVRYQWSQPDFATDDYLSAYYYQGGFDAPAIFEFSIDGIWRLLTYHLPGVVATAALAAFAILLAAAFLRKFQGTFSGSVIAVLLSFCIAVSVGAAVLGIYPLGGIHQNLYLGPVIFLAAGVSIHWMADSLSGLTRRGGLAPALAVAAVGVIALAGVGAMRRDSPYKTPENIKSVLAVLKERVREDDMVFAVYGTVPAIRFYQGREGRPANYYYGTYWCTESADPCLREMADLVISHPPNRIFLVYDLNQIGEVFELLGEQVSVERILADGYFHIFLIENVKESVEPAARAANKAFVSGEPVIRSTFDVYLRENTLTYVKEPCAPADTEAAFFLHLHPVDVNDLPDHRRQYGFDNLDFRFDGRGEILDGRCMAAAALPEYDILRVSTGQYVPGQGQVWKVEFPWREGK